MRSAILLIIACFAAAPTAAHSRPPAPPAQPDAASSQPTVVPSQPTVTSPQPKAISSQPTFAAAPGLFDPTRPPDAGLLPEAGEEESDTLRVDAVVISEDRRIAIVNGSVVQPGDELAGLHVVEIRPWGVLLDDAGESIELRLSPLTKQSAGPPPEEP